MLPIKKLYIDTRFKTSNSKSDTDFTVDLPQNYHFPENTVFYIDDVSIPVSWTMIQEGRNNKLYFFVNGVYKVAELTSGNYNVVTLNNEIVNKMNAVLGEPLFASNPDTTNNKIQITCLGTMVLEILTDEQLYASGYKAPLQSCNDVLRNTTVGYYGIDNPFISNYIDLYPIRNLYLVSSNLGNFNTMSVSGFSNIIKKIPVSANYNEIISDRVTSGIDYLDCSRQTLSQLSFRLIDVFGNIVNLQNNHWSFSIIFSKLQELN